ncbi:MAG TPA: SHOCT domain-containing protein [Amycolatopsis sp.]|nr:SHOCT domain-containing protein [Amycolatopsis sp.]
MRRKVMMYWHGYGMGGWGYALFTASTVLFWVLVIAAVVALVRYFGRRTPGPGSGPATGQGTGPGAGAGPGPAGPAGPVVSRPTPEQLLAERFARGEIDEEEYRHALDILRHHSPAPGSSSPGAG